MEPLSQAELAQCAAENVAMVASNLLEKYRPKIRSRKELVCNLAKLAGSLMNASLDQEKYEQGEHQDQQDGVDRLEEFLYLLELVCTVRGPIYPYILLIYLLTSFSSSPKTIYPRQANKGSLPPAFQRSTPWLRSLPGQPYLPT